MFRKLSSTLKDLREQLAFLRWDRRMAHSKVRYLFGYRVIYDGCPHGRHGYPVRRVVDPITGYGLADTDDMITVSSFLPMCAYHNIEYVVVRRTEASDE